MSEQAPSVSVVIPCYNEEKNLQRGVLDEVNDYLAQQAFDWEVIVADDGSTDGSLAFVEQYVADKPRWILEVLPHGGKPSALWGGVQRARCDLVLFTDMDQSTPIGELDKLLPGVAQGYPVVIGSRGMSREGFSLLRQVGSIVFRTMRSAFLLRQVRDTQCGFKLFQRELILETLPKLQFFQGEAPKGWKVTAYDVELLYLLDRGGHGILEVEVEWENRDVSDTKGHSSEMQRYLRESVSMAREVLRVNINRIKGMYD